MVNNPDEFLREYGRTALMIKTNHNSFNPFGAFKFSIEDNGLRYVFELIEFNDKPLWLIGVFDDSRYKYIPLVKYHAEQIREGFVYDFLKKYRLVFMMNGTPTTEILLDYRV